MDKFLAYFQAFTNTYAPVSDLKAVYDSALSHPEILGMVVGTRPDCVPDEVLALLASYSPEKYVSIELGLQSLDDAVLKFYQRRHTVEDARDAIQRIRALTQMEVGIHLMFGAPGETIESAVKAAQLLSEWKVDGVKIHQLMVLKNTVLGRYFEKRPWPLPRMEEYNEWVQAFLENLDPSICVERTHALSSNHADLIGPAWSMNRFEPMNHLKRLMRSAGSYQGRHARKAL